MCYNEFIKINVESVMNYDELLLAGMDIPDLLNRLMNNDKLIGLFVKKFLEDANYQKLVDAFISSDIKAAESASHTLKGMCGNLSLKKLFALFTEQVRLIRSLDFIAAEAMMEQISREYENTVLHMKNWLDLNA